MAALLKHDLTLLANGFSLIRVNSGIASYLFGISSLIRNAIKHILIATVGVCFEIFFLVFPFSSNSQMAARNIKALSVSFMLSGLLSK